MSVFLLMYMSVVVCYPFFPAADCEPNYLSGDNKVTVNLGKWGGAGFRR